MSIIGCVLSGPSARETFMKMGPEVKIATTRSGEVEKSMEKSRPWMCLIRSVRD